MQHTQRGACDLLTAGSALAADLERRGCGWRFDEYVSSAWEQEWLQSGWMREASACRAMALPEVSGMKVLPNPCAAILHVGRSTVDSSYHGLVTSSSQGSQHAASKLLALGCRAAVPELHEVLCICKAIPERSLGGTACSC